MLPECWWFWWCNAQCSKKPEKKVQLPQSVKKFLDYFSNGVDGVKKKNQKRLLIIGLFFFFKLVRFWAKTGTTKWFLKDLAKKWWFSKIFRAVCNIFQKFDWWNKRGMLSSIRKLVRFERETFLFFFLTSQISYIHCQILKY